MSIPALILTVTVAVAVWALLRDRPWYWLTLLVAQAGIAFGYYFAHRWGFAVFWTVIALTSLANAALARPRAHDERRNIL